MTTNLRPSRFVFRTSLVVIYDCWNTVLVRINFRHYQERKQVNNSTLMTNCLGWKLKNKGTSKINCRQNYFNSVHWYHGSPTNRLFVYKHCLARSMERFVVVNYFPSNGYIKRKRKVTRILNLIMTFAHRKLEIRLWVSQKPITDLFAGEENRCCCESQFKIGRCRFSHCLGRRHEVQQIVDELEGQTKIFAVLKGCFDERRISSRYCCGLWMKEIASANESRSC